MKMGCRRCYFSLSQKRLLGQAPSLGFLSPKVTRGDLWKWSAIHLTQKTPLNHANQKIQIFMFTLTHQTAQDIKGMHIRKLPNIWKTSLQRSNVYHSVIAMVELVGVLRPNSEAGHGVSGPKQVLNFAAHA